VSAFIVPGDVKGVEFGKKEEKMGWTNQPTALVTFDNVRIPAANLIAKEGDGFKIAMKALDGGRINIASCSLGGAAFCLEAAKKYMNGRKQFGKALSEFQYLQFKFADMASDLVTSRYLPSYPDLSSGKPLHCWTKATQTRPFTRPWQRRWRRNCALEWWTTRCRCMEATDT
jgi:alkylation response protein AidB-like acyl-CoA dehydrogenase